MKAVCEIAEKTQISPSSIYKYIYNSGIKVIHAQIDLIKNGKITHPWRLFVDEENEARLNEIIKAHMPEILRNREQRKAREQAHNVRAIFTPEERQAICDSWVKKYAGMIPEKTIREMWDGNIEGFDPTPACLRDEEEESKLSKK